MHRGAKRVLDLQHSGSTIAQAVRLGKLLHVEQAELCASWQKRNSQTGAGFFCAK
jgi:hypothetical protein